MTTVVTYPAIHQQHVSTVLIYVPHIPVFALHAFLGIQDWKTFGILRTREMGTGEWIP